MDSVKYTLVYVWAFLTLITIASWFIARNTGLEFHVDTVVSLSVFAIAAIKAHLLMGHFMEVRNAPKWLKKTCLGWLVFLFAMLSAFYLSAA